MKKYERTNDLILLPKYSENIMSFFQTTLLFKITNSKTLILFVVVFQHSADKVGDGKGV